ncbi:MAG TPA: aminoacyl-tRNA hydrolase [Xanthobacteraceae bacterium]|jgi:PTH1 family peptidyl-tRNA hydrolase|nr:aminoacyl-tRNA hydrolase [Xanthobacteraceae bacterium]
MLLFVGLGNPGSQYVRNRHNIGFMTVDAIAKRHSFPPWRRRFQGVTAEGTIGGKRALLLLPGTFMNESGRAVNEAMNFYKIALGDIIVFQDEIDLPPAKLRVKTGGGNAGHNGLRSISAHVGNEYRRIRIGVGHPGAQARVHNHVLQDFAKSEMPWVDAMCEAIAENAAMLARGEDASFQNKIHLVMDAKGFADKTPGDKAP